MIRVGISVTFSLTSHPSRGPTNTGEQASQNKMFTLKKSIVISRISPVFTGKNKRFWEFPKRVGMLKKTGRLVDMVKTGRLPGKRVDLASLMGGPFSLSLALSPPPSLYLYLLRWFLTTVLPGVFVMAHLECCRETETAILAALTNLPVWDFQTWQVWMTLCFLCRQCHVNVKWLSQSIILLPSLPHK